MTARRSARRSPALSLRADGRRSEDLAALLPKLQGVAVALLGDLVLDEFAYGEITRVSREAPVLILEYKRSIFALGGGGNTAANLASLGARVRPVGRVGRDPAGESILEQLEERRIDTSGVIRDRSYRSPVKTRILAGSAHTSKQQIVRVDRGGIDQPLERDCAARILSRLAQAARRSEALLVADYHFGAASPALLRAVTRPPIVTLDSRFRIARYRGVTAATPNVSEVEQALGLRIADDDLRALAAAGGLLLKALRARALVVTRGSRGMSLFERGRPPVHYPAFGTDEVADVTGAGDTVISAFTLALAAGGSFREATQLANIAGGIVVTKRGTATVSAAEIQTALVRGGPPPLR